MHGLLTPAQMNEADRLTIAKGGLSGFALMQNAAVAVADHAENLFGEGLKIAVLCGPGNNGGDGYLAAHYLALRGRQVVCFRDSLPRDGSDAQQAAASFDGAIQPLATFVPQDFDGVIDALYGAGLTRPIAGAELDVIEALNAANLPVLAVDLPSGISGDSGAVLGAAVKAVATVTFFRKKPGHVLQPGRAYCGDIELADIGITAEILDVLHPSIFENTKTLWHSQLPRLRDDTYKYQRGHAAVFSGNMTSTGAARLAALAAARIGAGAVTLLSPPDALAVNAAHLTSIMLRETRSTKDVLNFVKTRKVSAVALGPGYGNPIFAREIAIELLGAGHSLRGIVLDADGITSFEDQPELLFSAPRAEGVSLILTPHEGEFKRIFSDIAADQSLSKLEKARVAAKRAQAIIIYKGPDTVIASPDGRAAINTNGTALLATAGSGDVLTGIVCGLLAQSMPAFEAACAGVWIHADTASRFGLGLIAEDLADFLPKTLSAF